MTTFSAVLFFAILIGALIGIGAGVHIAYRIADSAGNDEYRDNNPYRVDAVRSTAEFGAPKEPGIASRKRRERAKKKTEKKAKGEQKEPETENKLQARMKDQTKESFSEFDCQFDGQDHKEKLKRIMSEQDSAYNCLASEVGK